MFVVDVIPICSSFPQKTLSYLSKEKMPQGTLVSIPLRKKNVLGITTNIYSVTEFKQNIKNNNFILKYIHKKIDENIFSKEYLETIFEFSSFWHLSPGKLIDITYSKKIRSKEENFIYQKEKTNQKKQKTKEKYLMLPFFERIVFYKKEFIKQKKGLMYIVCPTLNHIKNIETKLCEQGIEKKDIYTITHKSSLKKIVQTKKEISEKKSIIISTALFLDIFTNNETIIVLEKDSSPQYERVLFPKINLRLFIQEYAKRKTKKIIYADVIFDTERLYQKKIPNTDFFNTKKISIYNQKEKHGSKKTDKERIDQLKNNKKYNLINEKILKKIKKELKENKKIFCYVSKKNLATNIICNNCGSLLKSPETETPYRLSQHIQNGFKKNIFINKNNEQIPAFDICPTCGGRLLSFGIGTETIQQELKKNNILSEIIDANHSKTKKNIEEKLQKQIIIGTNMVFPYLEYFDSFYILGIDNIFSKMSYSAEFDVLYIISQILEYTNNIKIQTRNVLEQKLPLLKKKNFNSYLLTEYKNAKKYSLPPEIVTIEITHKENHEKLKIWEHYYKENLKIFFSHTRFLYEKNKLVMKIYLQCNRQDWNIKKQNDLIKKALPIPSHNTQIEINPRQI